VNDRELAKAVYEAIGLVSEANSYNEIPNLKKLKGYKNAFRIRIGDYRIGVIIENDIVIFTAFAHRKDIYRNLP